MLKVRQERCNFSFHCNFKVHLQHLYWGLIESIYFIVILRLCIFVTALYF